MSSSSLLRNTLVNRLESINDKENNMNSLFMLNEILKVLQHIDGDLHKIVDINTKILAK